MRVASLVPSTTEMVAAMGLGHRLVARTHECDYPPGIGHVPPVTRDLLDPAMAPDQIDRAVAASVHDAHTIYALDEEALAASEPDVVLTQATCAVCAVDAASVEQTVCTMPHEARIVSFDPTTLDDVVDGPAQVGEAIGALRQGLALASHLRHRLEWLRRRVSDAPRRRVAAIEWPDPLYAPGHWVPDMIEAAGGTSVFGTAGARSERAEPAQLVAAAPDVVVFAFCGYDLPTTMRLADDVMAGQSWEGMRELEPELLALDGSGYASRPGPRIIDGVEALAWALHRAHPDLRPGPGVMARKHEEVWWDIAAA